MMTKGFSFGIALLITLSLAATGIAATESNAISSNQIVMILADNHPYGYPTVVGDLAFAKAVEEKSKGRIVINVKASGQLGDEKSVIAQVQLGTIEFARVNPNSLIEFNKSFGVFTLPYLFDNQAHLWDFLNSSDGKAMLIGLEAGNLRGLTYYTTGSRNFYSSKPLSDITSLKGLKIRMPNLEINMDIIAALGASATPMPYGQVFSSLQTGVIEGAENNFPNYDSSNHYQVAKFIIVDQHRTPPEVLLISKIVWDKLSNEDKKIIQEAADESTKVQIEAWKIYENHYRQNLIKAGVTIVEVTDLTPWQDATKSVIDKYRPDYQKELENIAKYRK